MTRRPIRTAADWRAAHRPGPVPKILQYPEVKAFVDELLPTTILREIAARARARFGDRAPAYTAIWKYWDAIRNGDGPAVGPGAPLSGLAPEGTRTPEECGTQRAHPLQQRARCRFCETQFSPRRTGGSQQRFCGVACRRAFDAAARAYVTAAVADGSLSVAELRRAAGDAKD